MSDFKVGEIAIGCNMQFDTAYNGMECEILEGVQTATALFGGRWKTIDAYWVMWQNGTESWAPTSRLRKKRPPESDNSTARQFMLDCIERAKMGMGVDCA